MATQLCGCSPLAGEPSRNDLLGVWEARHDGHVARMELHGDGTLKIEDLPRGAIATSRPDDIDWSDTVDATGEWSYFEPESKPLSTAGMYVSLEDADDLGVFGAFPLYPAPAELILYYGDVEIGRHLTFARATGAATSPPDTVQRADLVGAWSARDGSELRLNRDGTFELTDVPLAVAAVERDDVTGDEVLDLHGGWTFEEAPLPLDDTAGLTLHFEGVYGHEPQLFDNWGLTLRSIDDAFSLNLEGASVTWLQE